MMLDWHQSHKLSENSSLAEDQSSAASLSMACCPWSNGLRPTKTFQLVGRCYQLLSGILAKGHLPRVSLQSRQSLMIRVIMKLSRGLCTDLLAFASRLRKSLARTPSARAVRPVIASNEVPSIQIKSVGSYSKSGREKESKRGKDMVMLLSQYELKAVRLNYVATGSTTGIYGYYLVFKNFIGQ